MDVVYKCEFADPDMDERNNPNVSLVLFVLSGYVYAVRDPDTETWIAAFPFIWTYRQQKITHKQ